MDCGEGPGPILFFAGCDLVCSALELHAEATSSHLGLSGPPFHILAIAIFFVCLCILSFSFNCVILNLFSVTVGALEQRPANTEALRTAIG